MKLGNVMLRFFLGYVIMSVIVTSASSQHTTNYDESKVGQYTLPELLVTNAGERVSKKAIWETTRRAELLQAFAQEIYGTTPTKQLPVTYTLISEDKNALNGKAIRREIKMCFSSQPNHCANILIYTPTATSKPVPVFVGLNYEGNHTVTSEEGIQLNYTWQRRTDLRGIVQHRATEASRGSLSKRWEVENTIKRGYGLVTVHHGDFELDRPSRSEGKGIRELLSTDQSDSNIGTIGMWSWGLSRVLDYLETDPLVNAKKVAVIGHSRLGKAALWAAAQDARFAMAISNNSGEGGASLYRRNFGETIYDLDRVISYWFSPNLKKYVHKAEQLPIDAHALMALLAPRPVYVGSASEDLWADPLGEYLSLYHALPVYQLYKQKGFQETTPPAIGQQRIVGKMGYHNRKGVHDITLEDWQYYLNFADKHF